MAKNYIKPGEHLTFTAGADTPSGSGVLLGTLLGVALTTVANGSQGEAAVEGVWELPKTAGAAINAWSKPIWDVSAGAFIASANTGTSGVLYSAGDFSASRAVANGDTLNVTVTVSAN